MAGTATAAVFQTPRTSTSQSSSSSASGVSHNGWPPRDDRRRRDRGVEPAPALQGEVDGTLEHTAVPDVADDMGHGVGRTRVLQVDADDGVPLVAEARDASPNRCHRRLR